LAPSSHSIERLHRRRNPRTLLERVSKFLRPPEPFVLNPREAIDAPLGRWNLYIGGGGCRTPGYVNIDLFASGLFQRVECDAVLEHVRCPEAVMGEIERVLAPGGYAHLVTPFCHPFHEYPMDFRRFTPDGLRLLAGSLEVVAEGWRTGPTASVLVFLLEYVKLLLPWRWWRVLAHGTLGWLLFPFRYLDLPLLATVRAGRIGNHCYVWLRKNPSC
jgi:SAM-dependent methyltransferase